MITGYDRDYPRESMILSWSVIHREPTIALEDVFFRRRARQRRLRRLAVSAVELEMGR